MGSKKTEAKQRYEASHGIIVKSFKMKREFADEFAEACKKAGVSQTGQITKMMQEFIEQNK